MKMSERIKLEINEKLDIRLARNKEMKEHYLNEYDTVIVGGVKIWGKDEH